MCISSFILFWTWFYLFDPIRILLKSMKATVIWKASYPVFPAHFMVWLYEMTHKAAEQAAPLRNATACSGTLAATCISISCRSIGMVSSGALCSPWTLVRPNSVMRNTQRWLRRLNRSCNANCHGGIFAMFFQIHVSFLGCIPDILWLSDRHITFHSFYKKPVLEKPIFDSPIQDTRFLFCKIIMSFCEPSGIWKFTQYY